MAEILKETLPGIAADFPVGPHPGGVTFAAGALSGSGRVLAAGGAGVLHGTVSGEGIEPSAIVAPVRRPYHLGNDPFHFWTPRQSALNAFLGLSLPFLYPLKNCCADRA